MQKIPKTNAARLLDRAGISYTLIPYTVDESDLSATHLAETLGQDINRIFKTLVLWGTPVGHFVCVVPGNTEVDLKKAARAAGAKKAEMIPMKELLPLTGYMRGGCTAIGMRRPFPVFVDSRALDYDSIYVSAGRRGLQMLLDPRDLIACADASVADLTTDPQPL